MVEKLKGTSIVISSKLSLAKNNTTYATVQVRSEEVNTAVNVWGVGKTNPFKVGSLVQFTKPSENNGFYSCKITDTIIMDPSSTNPLNKFLPQVVTEQQWNDLISQICNLIKDQVHSNVFRTQGIKLYKPYSVAPAARANHHAYPGGLLQHTYEILALFVSVYSTLPFNVNPFIVAMACLFHDFGKLSEYTSTTEYTQTFFLKGHPVLSAEVCGQVMKGMNPSLIEHTQHAILAHHGRLEWGSPVVPATPEAFLVHHLDMLSGHGVIFRDVESGQASRALNTTVYHYADQES